jgi:hypothetical protein
VAQKCSRNLQKYCAAKVLAKLEQKVLENPGVENNESST